jgi:hypothetical protein
MFDSTKKLHQLRPHWSAEQRSDEDELLAQYQRNEKQSLTAFIDFAATKKARLIVDFLIDDISFALWFNLNISRRKTLNRELLPNLSFGFDFSRQHGQIAADAHLKLHLRQLFALPIRYEDAFAVALTMLQCRNMTNTEIENIANDMLTEEQSDTALFLSACCGDRACGAVRIQVSEQFDSYIWRYNIYGYSKQNLQIKFDKPSYKAAFSEILAI